MREAAFAKLGQLSNLARTHGPPLLFVRSYVLTVLLHVPVMIDPSRVTLANVSPTFVYQSRASDFRTFKFKLPSPVRTGRFKLSRKCKKDTPSAKRNLCNDETVSRQCRQEIMPRRFIRACASRTENRKPVHLPCAWKSKSVSW